MGANVVVRETKRRTWMDGLLGDNWLTSAPVRQVGCIFFLEKRAALAAQFYIEDTGTTTVMNLEKNTQCTFGENKKLETVPIVNDFINNFLLHVWDADEAH